MQLRSCARQAQRMRRQWCPSGCEGAKRNEISCDLQAALASPPEFGGEAWCEPEELALDRVSHIKGQRSLAQDRAPAAAPLRLVGLTQAPSW